MLEDLKNLMRSNFLKYASYVILERAIPNIDGLKPVQRRILYTLFTMDDGKFHKVANAVGQTMAYHPHGDAPISEALINLANKGFLLDRQGNFGNIYTGDPASAPRYIETRLSPLARETLFNKDLMSFIPSYDSRNKEPIILSAKIPLLLMQGAEGIAVGMSTRILPHNFTELLEASINILQGKEFDILPDFPTGGLMDISQYDKGRGKIKLRTKIETPNEKTIIIKEICYGTTTESLIHSIDEAAKKGKIKIDTINDYTADKVEIEITLPRGQYADKVTKALYAFTDCEVSLNSQIIVIKDHLPWETTVDEVLQDYVERLQNYLRQELEIELQRLTEKIFYHSLERIFIENKMYKHIEKLSSYEKIHSTIAKELKPFHDELSRVPKYEDRERLLQMPIRRISRFDLDKNHKDIIALEKRVKEINKELSNIKRHTINYLKGLMKKYAEDYPRKTKIREIEDIDVRTVAKRKIKVGIDLDKGFIGTKVSTGKQIECSNFDKLLLFYDDGTFQIISIPEKQYLLQNGSKIVYVNVADKKTIIRIMYRDNDSLQAYIKRFVVKQFILNKTYRFIDEGTKLLHFDTQEGVNVKVRFKPKLRQKVSSVVVDMDSVAIKGVSARGIRISNKPVKSIKVLPPPPKPKDSPEQNEN